MLKKTLLALVLVVLICPTEVRAVEDWLPADILVTQRDGLTPVIGGRIELCRVGEIREDGYVLGEEFGGGFLPMEEPVSPDFSWWLSGKAGIGLILTVGEQGMVRFTGNSPGLYLVRQNRPAEGYYNFRPYLVSVSGEMTLVDTYPVMERLPENPRTNESVKPWFAALGVAVTLTGLLFAEEARRREEAEKRKI